MIVRLKSSHLSCDKNESMLQASTPSGELVEVSQ